MSASKESREVREKMMLQGERQGFSERAAASLLALLKSPEATSAKKLKTTLGLSWPTDWKYREASVKGSAASYRVPMYVVRIDAGEAGYAGTHGWQVRYKKSSVGSAFFSDSTFDTEPRKGTPADSLEAAMVYLAAIWNGREPPALPAKEVARKKVKTGMPGVRVTWKRRGSSESCFVRVDDVDGKPIANLYVGIGLAVTEEKLKDRVDAGVKMRQAHLKSIGRLSGAKGAAK